jgi:O-6-methylguanine DNA methyltransferase
MTETLIYTTHASPIGKLLLVASHQGLRYVTTLPDDADVATVLARIAVGADFVFESHGFLATACAAIDDYLTNGTPLTLPFDLASGTPLQRAVWLQIAKIPHGETISYTTLADRVGFPRAVRAVASACGANPLLLVVPCHRVLAKDGSLGGYSGYGGLELKRRLLALEAGEDWKAAVA